MDPYFILGGALVGFVVGATGVGGGSLMTPLLTLAFNVPAQIAVGTDLLFASLTKASGAVAHARRGSVDWRITAYLVAGSLPAALLTLGAVHVLRPDAALFGEIVKRTLGAALFLTAAGLVFKAQIQALGARLLARPTRVVGLSAAGGSATYVSAVRTEPDRARPASTVAIGAVIGTLVTLTSVGAGVIGVVALFFLYPLLPARRIVGTDIAHAVPLTLVAGLGHVSLGHVDWTMLAMLLIGSLPAIHLGAAVAHRLPERALRLALATMLVGIGVRLAFA